MSAREGFRRIEIFYYRRWWIVAAAIPGIFLYRYLSQPMPVTANSALWFFAKPVLLAVVSLVGLMTAAWIAAGFFAPEAKE